MTLLLLHHPKKTAAGDATDLATALVGFWPLDEASGNALDSHSNGLDLTDNATVTADATGSPSGAQCRVFTAANSEYFSRADESLMQFGNTDWTLAGWIRKTSNTGMAISAKRDSTSTSELQHWQNGTSNARVRTYDGTSTVAYQITAGDPYPSATTWYSYMIAFDATANTLTWFVDGVQHAQDTTEATAPGTSSSPFTLGTASGIAFFDGKMSAHAKWSDAKVLADAVLWHNSGSELGYRDIVPASGFPFIRYYSGGGF